jgi:hypothetical protein
MSKLVAGSLSFIVVALVACGSGGSSAGLASAARSAKDGKPEVEKVFSFERMTGNVRPFIGAAGAIRGVNAGGFPWLAEEAEVSLTSDSVLHVKVEALGIDPNDAAAQAAGVAGRNPVAAFGATVSCQTVDATGAAVVVNVRTPTHPTVTGVIGDPGVGDVKFADPVVLPSPCIAPIVFVTNPGGAWFLATGF